MTKTFQFKRSNEISAFDKEILKAMTAKRKSPKEKIPGGLASGMSPDSFDKEQLSAGTKVEMEHTGSKKVAQEIAMDHLREDFSYYKKLRKMEEKSIDDPDLMKALRAQVPIHQHLVQGIYNSVEAAHQHPAESTEHHQFMSLAHHQRSLLHDHLNSLSMKDAAQAHNDIQDHIKHPNNKNHPATSILSKPPASQNDLDLHSIAGKKPVPGDTHEPVDFAENEKLLGYAKKKEKAEQKFHSHHGKNQDNPNAGFHNKQLEESQTKGEKYDKMHGKLKSHLEDIKQVTPQLRAKIAAWQQTNPAGAKVDPFGKERK